MPGLTKEEKEADKQRKAEEKRVADAKKLEDKERKAADAAAKKADGEEKKKQLAEEKAVKQAEAEAEKVRKAAEKAESDAKRKEEMAAKKNVVEAKKLEVAAEKEKKATEKAEKNAKKKEETEVKKQQLAEEKEKRIAEKAVADAKKKEIQEAQRAEAESRRSQETKLAEEEEAAFEAERRAAECSGPLSASHLKTCVGRQDPSVAVNTFLHHLTTCRGKQAKKAKQHKEMEADFKAKAGPAKMSDLTDSFKRVSLGWELVHSASLDMLDGINALRELLILRGVDKLQAEDVNIMAQLNSWVAALGGLAGQQDAGAFTMLPISARDDYEIHRSRVLTGGSISAAMCVDASACLQISVALDQLLICGLKIVTFATRNAGVIISDVEIKKAE